MPDLEVTVSRAKQIFDVWSWSPCLRNIKMWDFDLGLGPWSWSWAKNWTRDF